jgi:hypothetical protein
MAVFLPTLDHIWRYFCRRSITYGGIFADARSHMAVFLLTLDHIWGHFCQRLVNSLLWERRLG